MDHFFLVLIVGFVYFLPTVIAYKRSHNNDAGIFLLNLFVGWTIIGWLAALIWSVSSNVYAPPAKKIEADDLIACPKCAELIKRAAIKCRHCQSDISPPPA